MKVLHRYQVLEETRSVRNAHIWRGFHIAIYCLIAIFGAFSTWWFYKLLLVFGGNCVLNPSSVGFVTFTANRTNDSLYKVSNLEGPDVEYWTSSPLANNIDLSTVNPNRTVDVNVDNGTIAANATNATTSNSSVNVPGRRVTIVDVLHTSWASEETCDLRLYAPLLSVIFGVIWLVFFVMCPPSGEKSITGMEQPWRILIPAGVFSLGMVGASLHAAWTIKSGLANLCKHFYNATGSYQCTSDLDALAPSPSSSILGAGVLITLSVWCVWSCALCWLACALLVLVRLLVAPDFVLRTVTVRLVEADAVGRRVHTSDDDAESTFTTFSSLVKAGVYRPSTASTKDAPMGRRIGNEGSLGAAHNDRTDTTQPSSPETPNTLPLLVKADIYEPSTAITGDEHVQRQYGKANLVGATYDDQTNTNTYTTHLTSPEPLSTLSSLVKRDNAKPSTASTSEDSIPRQFAKVSLLKGTYSDRTDTRQLKSLEADDPGVSTASTSDEQIQRQHEKDSLPRVSKSDHTFTEKRF